MKLVFSEEFTPTITPNTSYRLKIKHTKEGEYKCHRLYDGDNYIMSAHIKSICEHNEELEDNECYVIFERFMTEDGQPYLYTGDIETGEDFLVVWSKHTAISYEEEDE